MDTAPQVCMAAVELEVSNAPLSIRRQFDPAAHGLEANFRLTKFAELRGWGCKVPQETLNKLLEGLDQDGNMHDATDPHYMHMAMPRIGKNIKLKKKKDIV